MSPSQPGILAPVPRVARFLCYRLRAGGEARAVLGRLAAMSAADRGDESIVGLGRALLLAAGRPVDGLREHPRHSLAGVDVPSTGAALWLRLVGPDPGALVHATTAWSAALGPDLALDEVTDAFRYDVGRDLSGYIDGTENPKGQDAPAAALVQGQGPGQDGASFVAVQRWVHDMPAMAALSKARMDDLVGRDRDTDAERTEAPPTAHVKRAAQESFTPAAFVLRRSMPWSCGAEAGLVFIAFGHSLDAYEAILARMCGLEDGQTDGLFQFTRPVTGLTAWCPPLRADGRLDLSAIRA